MSSQPWECIPSTPAEPIWCWASPLFNKVEIVRENGNILIKTIDNSNENIYVKLLKVNGKEKPEILASAKAFIN